MSNDFISLGPRAGVGLPAMELLRYHRNIQLRSTDWWSCSDLVMSDERKAYRQALRDLPSTAANPSLDENGELTGVTFPTKP